MKRRGSARLRQFRSGPPQLSLQSWGPVRLHQVVEL